MSLDATVWAWRANVSNASQRLILLSLADRAGEDHKCYPSIKRLVKDTKMNRKTIMKGLDDLEERSFIKFTGEIKGNGVKVYQLLHVKGREDIDLTSTTNGTGTETGTAENDQTNINLGTSSKNGTSTKIGTGSSTKNGTGTSTKIGTQNLPIESPIESINKKDWLDLKKLRQEIFDADQNLDFEHIAKSRWAEREKRAFEIYNAGREICDDLMNYHFADWLINAYYTKYEGKPDYNSANKHSRSSLKPAGLTEKQIFAFAMKLAHHPEIAGKVGVPGESFEELGARIAMKLSDPVEAKKLELYLKQVGFKGELLGAA